MNQIFIGILVLVAWSLSTNASDQCPGALGVQSKEAIVSTVDRNKGIHTYAFVKDLPILAYEITSSKFSSLPQEISNVLGAVDQTTYTEEYLAQNIGSAIALQIKDGNPDFYIIGKDTYQSKYRKVPMAQLLEKNQKLVSQLNATSAGSILDRGDQNLVAIVKTVPVEMVRASHLGYPIEQELTIESPWGEQKKPAGKDAFLTYDASKNQYYMINVDNSGLPIGYVSARPEGTLSAEFLTKLVSNSGAKTQHFIKDLPIVGYRIVSSNFNDIPEGIREVLGKVDQTYYSIEYLSQNIGSVIALQMNGDQPDFYVIGKEVFQTKYVQVATNDFSKKNPKLAAKLATSSVGKLIEANDSNLVAIVKTVPVEMVKMSEVGLPTYDTITIESPWGEQTKPAGSDGYLTFDAGKNMFYMINSASDGRPIGYIEKK